MISHLILEDWKYFRHTFVHERKMFDMEKAIVFILIGAVVLLWSVFYLVQLAYEHYRGQSTNRSLVALDVFGIYFGSLLCSIAIPYFGIEQYENSREFFTDMLIVTAGFGSAFVGLFWLIGCAIAWIRIRGLQRAL